MIRTFLKSLLVGLCCTSFFFLSGTHQMANGANPLANLFVKVDANPNADYKVTEKNGPWMISAYVFRGEKADQQAKQLVYELRKEHKLVAYTYVHEADYSKTWNGPHVDKYGKQEVLRNQHNEKFKEVAVMVGDYPSSEDNEAKNTRELLKKLQPACLMNAGKSSDPLATDIEDFRKSVNQQKKRGPMSKAFLCTNPMLSKEYFQQNTGLDKLVLEMNSEGDHNLLNCPGTYSVRVATFRGSSSIDRKIVKDVITNQQSMRGKLQEAGDKAELLCHTLRERGYEAWVFHDRTESVVTVGSFQEIGLKRQDNKTEMDPQIHQIMKTFGPQGAKAGDIKPAASVELKPKIIKVNYSGELKNIALDAQPIPIQVPKRGIGAAYVQR